MHDWAGSYRARGWPPGTPEYLLSGYFRLLVTLGDLPRTIACAGDMTRHDRMLDMTGGDTAALAETRTVLDLIAAQDTPDLASALGLACHRDQLTDRNTNIPTSLPAVWATLGQVTRAEALATSITDPPRQAQALAGLAAALAQAGQHEQAEAVACSITDPGWQAQALAEVAAALARTGQRGQAEAVARSITDPGWQARALAEVAAALARGGQHEQAAAIAGQAEAVARSITDPYWQAQALAEMAGTLAQTGNFRYACRVAAASCAVGRWTAAAGSVLLLDPSAFSTLKRVLAER